MSSDRYVATLAGRIRAATKIPVPGDRSPEVSYALSVSDFERKVALLLAIIDEREEQIRQLQDDVAKATEVVVEFPRSWRLTATETAVLRAVYRRSAVVTKAAIFHEVYAGRPAAAEPDIKIVDVLICKVRKKLAAVGIGTRPMRSELAVDDESSIITVWGRGYVMADHARDAVRASIEAAAPRGGGLAPGRRGGVKTPPEGADDGRSGA